MPQHSAPQHNIWSKVIVGMDVHWEMVAMFRQVNCAGVLVWQVISDRLINYLKDCIMANCVSAQI
jgi:hypothetical protein